VKSIAEIVLLSWTKLNGHNPDKCNCTIRKKEAEQFFRPEMLDSIVDLAHSYDTQIQINESSIRSFLADIYPVVEIIRNFFKKFKDEHRVYLFCNFYSKFFDFKSNHLKNRKF
jgi:hypothetical protein